MFSDEGPRRSTEQDPLQDPVPEPGRGEPGYAVHTGPGRQVRQERRRPALAVYTPTNSLNSQDVSISPPSTPFETVRWIGPYLGNPEPSQAVFCETEIFRALRGPHAKSETTFVAREFKVAVRMCPRICAARIISVRAEMRCKCDCRSGRPNH